MAIAIIGGLALLACGWVLFGRRDPWIDRLNEAYLNETYRDKED